MSDVDLDAVEIGALYRKACGESGGPLQEGEISTPKYQVPVTDADVCHWCREPFKPPKRKRFVIMDEARHSGGWGLVSICFECFKHGWDGASREAGIKLERASRECAGCGEPISIPVGHFTGAWRWFRWQVCSNRCYQRYRRKRIRKYGSCIDWKRSEREHHCPACHKRFIARTDAKFCSNKCRQWHYRRRRAAS
jgi:hypothetical protein